IDISEQIYINNNIYYIDNPFIIDKINNSSNGYTLTEKKLINTLKKDYTNNMLENIIDSVKNKEILNKIKKLFDDAVNGKINSIGGFYYLDKVRFENLSTGIKSFIIIRMLLENGSLKEKDLLVLDEPEIHLHPEWQLLYAETIVLLQKYLDLTITITTHSPYFLEAINGYSKLHKIHNRVNFYFAEADDNNNVTINNVNDNINIIFKKMADPLKKLRNMRIEEFDNSKSEE
ncbi:AAA family ATPase, partial [uncultured Brachyspira sp.]